MVNTQWWVRANVSPVHKRSTKVVKEEREGSALWSTGEHPCLVHCPTLFTNTKHSVLITIHIIMMARVKGNTIIPTILTRTFSFTWLAVVTNTCAYAGRLSFTAMTVTHRRHVVSTLGRYNIRPIHTYIRPHTNVSYIVQRLSCMHIFAQQTWYSLNSAPVSMCQLRTTQSGEEAVKTYVSVQSKATCREQKMYILHVR